MEKIKALFFAANPALTTRLSLDNEIRAITEKIHASKHHDSIELVSALAAQPDDLLQKLNEHKPQIVHFSAHGNSDGELLLLDKNGKPKPVSARAIHSLLKTLKNNIRVVVLNACYSQVQAQEIKNVIDCVIGMKSSITDEAAIVFSASFYRAIGFGCSVQAAFEQGKTALLLEGIQEVDIPELLVKEGEDPTQIVLLGEKPPIFIDIETETTPFTTSIIRGGIIDGPVVNRKKNWIRVIHPFWILIAAILVPLLLSSNFTDESSTIHGMIIIQLYCFWIISILLYFYLTLSSLGEFRKKVEKVRTEGLLAAFTESIAQFSIKINDKPWRFISQLLLLLLLLPLIMESHYFFQNHLDYYHLYKVLLLSIALLSPILIQVKPENQFKQRCSEGIKILSLAMPISLILFSASPDINNGKYVKWVDHNLFWDLVKENPDPIYINNRIEKITKTSPSTSTTMSDKIIEEKNDNTPKPGKVDPKGPTIVRRKLPPEPTPNPPVPTPTFTIERIPITKEVRGNSERDACSIASDEIFKEFYQKYPHIKSLEKDQYNIDCTLLETLPDGQIVVKVTIIFLIKKEET